MKSWVRTLLICLFAEALNFFTAFLLYDTLHIPLFFDTIFTVAVTFYCGLVPGLCVGAFYNVISTLTLPLRGYTFDPYAFLFGICGMLVAFATWIFARRKEEFRVSAGVTVLYLGLIAMFSSALAVLSSGIIDYVRFTLAELPDRLAPVKNFTDSFVSLNFSLLASCFLAQIPISITDRLVSTFAGYGVYRIAVKFLGEESWTSR
ncbi:MAG: hypothetical protein J6I53_02080 [Treponema sp.]|nr:hypothetical protein [Treponema sp.]